MTGLGRQYGGLINFIETVRKWYNQKKTGSLYVQDFVKDHVILFQMGVK